MANLPAVFLIALPCALIEDAERQSITIFTVTENDAKALWPFPQRTLQKQRLKLFYAEIAETNTGHETSESSLIFSETNEVSTEVWALRLTYYLIITCYTFTIQSSF